MPIPDAEQLLRLFNAEQLLRRFKEDWPELAEYMEARASSRVPNTKFLTVFETCPRRFFYEQTYVMIDTAFQTKETK